MGDGQAQTNKAKERVGGSARRVVCSTTRRSSVSDRPPRFPPQMDSATSKKAEEEQRQADIRRQIALLQAQLNDGATSDPVVGLPPSPSRKRPNTSILVPETPSSACLWFLSTLIYAFWLSFTLTDNKQIAPTTWPLAWLVMALVVLWDPLPVMFPSSRWWLSKKTGKLLISGTKPVEFTDFWLG